MVRDAGAGRDDPDGMAMALALAMAAEGVDLNDDEAVLGWLVEYNALPHEERAEILEEGLIAGAAPVPAVEVPDEAEARASSTGSGLLAQARVLVEFVGEGRKLTQTGNLTLADARRLVDLLDTGDRVDETIGDRTFNTKSAAELPRLSFVLRLATGARFVRKVKGRLVATKAGRSLGRDPLADLDRLVEAIDTTGMVSARTAGGRYIWTSLAPFFDDLFVPLAVFLLAGRDVAFAAVVDNAFAQFEDEIDLDNPHWDEPRRHDFVASEMSTAIETLEAAGVASWASELETLPYGGTRRSGGTVTLTPAGRWVLHRYLHRAHDLELPVARPARLTGHDFEALIRVCETGGPDEFAHLAREISAWVDHRGERALAELADTARTTSDPAVRNLALAVLSEHFGPAAEPHVRTLLADPATRGAALLWLVDHELEPADVLVDPDRGVFLDVLALTLVSRGPTDMVEVFEHTGTHDTQTALLHQLARQPSPAAGPVLTALGRHHPTPRIAEAARNAALQHASRHTDPPR
ncbi:MAG: hypothetical protein MUF83_16075 [Acidimicrobiales bacterium]|jgi:hypothetical protein|nr:hypothetical protein [Acidimicrobiales bacterium]